MGSIYFYYFDYENVLPLLCIFSFSVFALKMIIFDFWWTWHVNFRPTTILSKVDKGITFAGLQNLQASSNNLFMHKMILLCHFRCYRFLRQALIKGRQMVNRTVTARQSRTKHSKVKLWWHPCKYCLCFPLKTVGWVVDEELQEGERAEVMNQTSRQKRKDRGTEPWRATKPWQPNTINDKSNCCWKALFLKCKNFQCGIGTIRSVKLLRACGWLAVIKTRHARGSIEQDRENNDGYSRVNELSQPDNLQWCRVMCVNEWGVCPNVGYNLTLLGGSGGVLWKRNSDWRSTIFKCCARTGKTEILPTESKQKNVETRVKRNKSSNGAMERKEKESVRLNKLEPCVNRVYRNQIWPMLKVIYRENAFSRVH